MREFFKNLLPIALVYFGVIVFVVALMAGIYFCGRVECGLFPFSDMCKGFRAIADGTYV